MNPQSLNKTPEEIEEEKRKAVESQASDDGTFGSILGGIGDAIGSIVEAVGEAAGAVGECIGEAVGGICDGL